MPQARCLPPGAADRFLAGGAPPDKLVRLAAVAVSAGVAEVGVAPALLGLVVGGARQVVCRQGAESKFGDTGVAPGAAVSQGYRFCQLRPVGRLFRRVTLARIARIYPVPVGIPYAIPGKTFTPAGEGIMGAIGSPGDGRGGFGYLEPLDPLGAPPFLLRKLKNAVNADAGNAGFALGQPALLGGDKAAENAAFPGIDGVIPLVAVFAGGPGFGLAKSVGLVNAAVEGLAAVFGQGFQDGDSPVGVGKGLPVGAVPGDRPGLRRGCPPPIKAIISSKAIAPATLRRDIAIPSRMKLWLLALPIGYYAGRGASIYPGRQFSGNLGDCPKLPPPYAYAASR